MVETRSASIWRKIRDGVQHRLRISDIHHHCNVTEWNIGVDQCDTLAALFRECRSDVRCDRRSSDAALEAY